MNNLQHLISAKQSAENEAFSELHTDISHMCALSKLLLAYVDDFNTEQQATIAEAICNQAVMSINKCNKYELSVNTRAIEGVATQAV